MAVAQAAAPFVDNCLLGLGSSRACGAAAADVGTQVAVLVATDGAGRVIGGAIGKSNTALADVRAAESGLSRASSLSSGLGEVRGTYTGLVNVGEAGPLRNNLAETFAGGRYDVVRLREDTILYRAGTADQPLGQFSAEPSHRGFSRPA